MMDIFGPISSVAAMIDSECSYDAIVTPSPDSIRVNMEKFGDFFYSQNRLHILK
jgi:hypothetical protein